MKVQLIVLLASVAFASADIQTQICDACHKYVGKADSVLANPANQESARKTLERVCNIFSLFGDEKRQQSCIQTIDNAVTKALTGAANGLEPNQFCAKIHACDAVSKRDLIEWDKWRQSACDQCHVVAGKVEGMLENPANQQRARSVLKSVCSIFSLIHSDENYKKCNDEIDSGFNSVLNRATNDFEPTKFCESIKICKAPAKRDLSDIRNKICDVCHEKLGQIEHSLGDQQNQQKVRQTLDKVCGVISLFSESEYKKCKDNVDNAITRAMNGASDSLEPNKFCSKIHACESGIAKRDFEFPQINFDGIRAKACDQCHVVAGKVDHLFDDPSNQQKARSFLENLCAIFTLFNDEKRHASCMQTIDDAVNRAMTGAASSFEPTNFCQKVHICKAQSKRDLSESICTSCHTYIGKVDAMFGNPENQQKARQTLERVCNIFTLFSDSERYNQCRQKIEDLVTRAMQGATNGLEPNKFCQQIHACSAKHTRSQEYTLGAFINPIRAKACDQCHSTLSSLDSVLANPNNEKKVENALSKFCSFYTLFHDEDGYNSCVQKVNQKVESVMTDLATNKLESNKFCRDIFICKA